MSSLFFVDMPRLQARQSGGSALQSRKPSVMLKSSKTKVGVGETFYGSGYSKNVESLYMYLLTLRVVLHVFFLLFFSSFFPFFRLFVIHYVMRAKCWLYKTAKMRVFLACGTSTHCALSTQVWKTCKTCTRTILLLRCSLTCQQSADQSRRKEEFIFSESFHFTKAKMKVTLKTLQQETFQIETEDDWKVKLFSYFLSWPLFAYEAFCFPLSFRSETSKKKLRLRKDQRFLLLVRSWFTQVRSSWKWSSHHWKSSFSTKMFSFSVWWAFAFPFSLLGKILADDQPLSQYNISESNFIVIMVAKVSQCTFMWSFCRRGSFIILYWNVATSECK